MTKRGPGRPPLNGTRQNCRVAVRMTTAERKLIAANAKRAGRKVSVYLRERGLAS